MKYKLMYYILSCVAFVIFTGVITVRALNCASGESVQTCVHPNCNVTFCAATAGICSSCTESDWVLDEAATIWVNGYPQYIYHPMPDTGYNNSPYCCGGETIMKRWWLYSDGTCDKCGSIRRVQLSPLVRSGRPWPCPSYVE